MVVGYFSSRLSYTEQLSQTWPCTLLVDVYCRSPFLRETGRYRLKQSQRVVKQKKNKRKNPLFMASLSSDRIIWNYRITEMVIQKVALQGRLVVISVVLCTVVWYTVLPELRHVKKLSISLPEEGHLQMLK